MDAPLTVLFITVAAVTVAPAAVDGALVKVCLNKSLPLFLPCSDLPPSFTASLDPSNPPLCLPSRS
jgi:hypothetical protein